MRDEIFSSDLFTFHFFYFKEEINLSTFNLWAHFSFCF